jgi:peptide/nickel transport system permease protein
VLRYLVSRILQAIVVVIGVATVVFLLERLLPGDPGRIMLGTHGPGPVQWAIYDHQNGLDKPIPVQYFDFIANLLHGRIAFTPPGFADQINPIEGVAVDLDLQSLVQGPTINSLILTGLSTLLVVAATVPIAIYEAARRRRRGAHLSNIISMTLYSIPQYLLGTWLILVLATDLHWLNVNTPDWSTGDVLADPAALILPTLTLSTGTVALFSRYLRASTIEELAKDYVTTARAKGASPSRVSLRHALPNASLPIITLLGTRLPQIFGAQLVVEVLFGYPGLGTTLWSAALHSDFYTMLGAILIGGVLTTLGSLITDLVYAAVDPRIRYVRART